MRSEFLEDDNTGLMDSKGATVLVEYGGKAAFFCTNIFCISAIFFLLTKYTENPTAIILIIIVLLLMLAGNFVEYIFVESEQFIVIFKSIFFSLLSD